MSQLSRLEPPTRHLPRTEAGSAAVELVLVAPLLVGLILTVVAGGRIVDARGQVNDAAYAGARAASLNLGPGGLDAGRVAAEQSLADRGKSCASLSVTFAGSDPQPGGRIRATVHCVTNLHDLVGFGLPGTKEFTAIAVVPIEQYRRP